MTREERLARIDWGKHNECTDAIEGNFWDDDAGDETCCSESGVGDVLEMHRLEETVDLNVME